MNNGGTQEANDAHYWMCVQAISLEMSQMLISLRTSCDGVNDLSFEVSDVTLPRKASSVNYTLPVPQTDTGSRGENPQVSE